MSMLITHAQLNSSGSNNGLRTPTTEKLYYGEDILALKADGANWLDCINVELPKIEGPGNDTGNAASGVILGTGNSGRLALPCPPFCDKGKPQTQGDLTFAEALAIITSP